ncbi:Malate permease [hydrothermal vent metagenome]|uniref:Malate permease n=1 Tax=hydrothermal vent metagenome TaxID=652676 RepID=A0A1W1BU44_9ZZZZ
MFETLFSIIFVYIFILMGYMAKRIFKEEFDSKTLTLFSVYFLQPTRKNYTNIYTSFKNLYKSK